NLSLVSRGCHSNLRKQIEIAHLFGVPVVVALNVFKTDTQAEIEQVCQLAKECGAFDAVPSHHWALGGRGSVELARAVKEASGAPSNFQFLYSPEVRGGDGGAGMGHVGFTGHGTVGTVYGRVGYGLAQAPPLSVPKFNCIGAAAPSAPAGSDIPQQKRTYEEPACLTHLQTTMGAETSVHQQQQQQRRDGAGREEEQQQQQQQQREEEEEEEQQQQEWEMSCSTGTSAEVNAIREESRVVDSSTTSTTSNTISIISK
ncbi:hypothetical protein CRUP_028705, partial [Coryphaenoides rupestris]